MGRSKRRAVRKSIGGVLCCGALVLMMTACGSSSRSDSVETVSATQEMTEQEHVDSFVKEPEMASLESTNQTESDLTESESETTSTDTISAETEKESDIVTQMNIQVGETGFTATLEKNTAVEELVQMMQEAPVVIEMSDYSGFEKVGALGRSLTTSNSQMTTRAGDIVLYSGNQIVIFYGSNSWSYTKLASIDDLAGWEEALGNGDVTVTFSID